MYLDLSWSVGKVDTDLTPQLESNWWIQFTSQLQTIKVKNSILMSKKSLHEISNHLLTPFCKEKLKWVD